MGKNLKDIEFVLKEVARFAKLSIAELRELSSFDNFSTLPHPKGTGEILCGGSAARRISEMAAREVRRSNYAGRLNIDDVSRNLGNLIVQRFLTEKRPLDLRQADRAIATAIRQAAANIVDLTHLIPCHLVAERDPDFFQIGPVLFSRREKRWLEIESQLRTFVENSDELDVSDETKNHKLEIRKNLSQEANGYYGSFDWIAEVTIHNCDPVVSEIQAKNKIQAALDCFQLLLGSYHSDRMKVGGIETAPTDRRSHLTLTSRGEVDISSFMSWHDNALGEGWWDILVDQNTKYIISLMGLALEQGTLLPDPIPLAHRFLDAARWFGDAVRDENDAAKIIKFVTAVERILIARQHEDIAEIIARRGAAFSKRGDEKLVLLRKQIKRIYGLRSELTHGSRSPSDPRVAEKAYLTELFAQRILIGVLYQYGDLGLRTKNITNAEIEKKYDEIVESIEKDGP